MTECAAGRNGELASQRARVAARQSEKLEMELEVLRGELVPVHAIFHAVYIPFVSVIKAKILSFPARVLERGAINEQQIKILEALGSEILTELSHDRLSTEYRRVVDEILLDQKARKRGRRKPKRAI